MANAGPNTNSSQFFFLFSPQKHLDGRHVILGEIDEGLEVLEAIEGKVQDMDGNWGWKKEWTDERDDSPKQQIVITDCGLC